MSSLNSIQIIGNLGRDVEVRRMQNGDAVYNFSVAVTEKWKDKNSGERKESTEWFNVTVWNENIGKIAEQYLKKGSKVFLEGKMKSRKYTDKDNVERQVWELVIDRFGGKLVLLGDPGEGRQGGDDRSSYGTGANQTSGGARPPLDDDIPF